MDINAAIPKGWVRTIIGEIAKLQSGVGFPKTLQGLSSGDFPLAKVSDITEAVKSNNGIISSANNYLSASDAKAIGAKIFPAGTTLFAKIGEAIGLNRRVLCATPILADNNVMGLIPKQDKILPKYLFYFMHLVNLYDYSQATAVPSVRKSDVEQISLLLPPLPEQERIVAKIEELFTQLDAGTAALRRVQAALKRYKASVLKAACEGRLVAQDPSDEPAEEMLRRLGKQPKTRKDCPSLPKGWCWTTVEQLTPPNRKCAYGVLQPGGVVKDGTLLIRVGDINNGSINIGNLKRIDPQIAAKYPRTKLQGGEVLITLVGAIGRSAIVPHELAGANTARAVGVIPLEKSINFGWVELWFRNPERISELTLKAHEVARKTLNLEDVRNSWIAMPSVNEQKRIVDEVDRYLSLESTVNNIIEISLTRTSRLRQSILKRAFEGKLVPQATAVEAAVAEELRNIETTAKRARLFS